ncbi:MAG TPA: sulfatase-like hydrolase/transferase [Polyangiaceae bacterium]|nr:sulfatase-like hydrolase/transferase [Polyangiaceae bacterium]
MTRVTPATPPAYRVALAALALAALALTPACSCRRSPDAASPPLPPADPAAGEDVAPAPNARVVLDVARDLDACTLGHRGVLLDFGDPSMRASLHPGTLGRSDDEVVEHEGGTWLRVRSRVLTSTFYWPAVADDEPDASAYVEARVRGILAHTVGVSIDGRPVGTWTLGRGETRIVMARGSSPVTLVPGGHELALHFVGGARATDEALAEIDWAHVGTGEPGDPYAAPTRDDAAVDATVGGRSMRSVSLRAPGFVRCSSWIPANATLEVSLATAGGGDADVEARLVRDRHAPIVLGTAHVQGGASDWAPWSLPVTGLEGDGALASLELAVLRAGDGTRVLLGAPSVVAAGTPPTATPPAVRSVVLVVLGSTSAKALAPWGGPHAVPELSRLAAEGTTFVANRASSSLADAVVASMLTGLPARAHGLDDPDARLPEGLVTAEEACRQGGIATAMFTANPTTGSVFGFDRGWDTFVAHDPLESGSATQVFDEAAAWIEAHRSNRFFVVVHARGGHPPWDAAPEDLKSMAPDGYLGIIEPRRAAEALAKVRKHPARFKDDDRVRAWALYDHAIDAHDQALGQLVAALRNVGREDDTAVVVTGDVAASEAPSVPFGDSDTLDEPLLATPLVVRWPPASGLGGRRVEAPTTPVDLARTMLDALGLAPPAAFQGIDLASLAQGTGAIEQRPLAATRAGRFSVRWGPYVLMGSHDRETRVCDLSLDPTCIADVRATSPLALEPIQRFAVDTLSRRPANAPRRSPIVVDAHTQAVLVRWGRLDEDHDKDDGR